MPRIACTCLALLLLAPLHAEPVGFTLKLAPGENLLWHERIEGKGELVRQATPPNPPERLELDAEALCDRLWTVETADPQGFGILSTCRSAQARIVMPEAEFKEQKPWRSFRLRVDAQGGIRAAEPVETPEPGPAQGPEAPGSFSGLPIDLDLGEVFTLLELGLLPPRAVQVGESWESPAGAAVHVRGRLAELEPGGQVARLDTQWSTTVPERNSPAPEVVVTGELSGSARVRFDLARGRVIAAKGPLGLRLEFKRRGAATAVATVALTLELSVDAGTPATTT